MDFRLEAATDDFCGARLFEDYEHGSPHLGEPLPLFGSVFGDSAGQRFGFGKQSHVDAVGLAFRFWKIFPDFLGGENEDWRGQANQRSEEHTSELQSRQYLVCRLLLEKKNKKTYAIRCTNHPKKSTDAKRHGSHKATSRCSKRISADSPLYLSITGVSLR